MAEWKEYDWNKYDFTHQGTIPVALFHLTTKASDPARWDSLEGQNKLIRIPLSLKRVGQQHESLDMGDNFFFWQELRVGRSTCLIKCAPTYSKQHQILHIDDIKHKYNSVNNERI
jgi:hypothetical protein